MNNQNNNNNVTNNNTINNNRPTIEREVVINRITREELDTILEHTINTTSMTEGKEVIPLDRNAVMNVINSQLGEVKQTFNQEKAQKFLDIWKNWQSKSEADFLKSQAIWDKMRIPPAIKDIINEKQSVLTNNKLYAYKDYIHANKETFISMIPKSLTQNKPLGSAGDITINELISKGLKVVDTPLVQMIKDNVNVSVVGGYLTSIILYKTVVKLYL